MYLAIACDDILPGMLDFRFPLLLDSTFAISSWPLLHLARQFYSTLNLESTRSHLVGRTQMAPGHPGRIRRSRLNRVREWVVRKGETERGAHHFSVHFDAYRGQRLPAKKRTAGPTFFSSFARSHRDDGTRSLPSDRKTNTGAHVMHISWSRPYWCNRRRRHRRRRK